jgi:8-oxo-dGTP pyrophosphatase MutT (NUDIX family)
LVKLPLPVPVRRAVYRLAFRILQVVWVVRRPHVHGAKCLITDGDRVLLVRHTYGDRAWDLPGGGIRRHEPPIAAAQREMEEELGLRAVPWSEIGELAEIVHHRRDTLHCFHVELQAPPLQVDPVEIATTRWFPRGELPYDLAPHVIPIIARTTVRH